MPDICCRSLTPCFTGPIRSDFIVGPLLEKLIVKTDLSDHFLKGSPKTIFWIISYVFHRGLMSNIMACSERKGFYISFIDKNSNYEDGTLKSSSIFFLIYYK